MAERTSHGSEDTTVCHAQPGFLIAALHDVLLVFWDLRATTETVLELERAARKLIDQFGKSAVIHVALPGALLPETEARRALEEVASRLAKDTTAVAVVLLGHGFWASAIRALVTSVRWGGLMTAPLNVHVCSTPEEATRWLASQHRAHGAHTPDVAELDAALQALLAHPQLTTAAEP